MLFSEREITLKDGTSAVIRNAVPCDGEELLLFLKKVAAQTPFLLNEPEEIAFTVEQEEEFINSRLESERELMLLAVADDEIIGVCAMSPVAPKLRYRHRCSVSVATTEEFFGLGLGRAMLCELLRKAAACGFEQAKLEVIVSNEHAVSLYKSLGFTVFGEMKRNMKYKDGSYADAYYMIKYF